MKILFIADIFGKPGRRAVQTLLPKLKKDYNIDITIANGENAAGGFGITQRIYNELIMMGIDVITTGNHIWDQKEIESFLENNKNIPLIRPANYPPGLPGKGVYVYNSVYSNYPKVVIINLQGRIFMPAIDCPFRKIDEILTNTEYSNSIIIVDFHAEATSEKAALGYYLDGRVSAVIGTHTHVQTADGKILPNNTAFITDAGMTGPHTSVIGVDKESAINRMIYQKHFKFKVAKENIVFNAVVVDIDNKTLKAVSIEQLFIPVKFN